jgi:hypothetical protein
LIAPLRALAPTAAPNQNWLLPITIGPSATAWSRSILAGSGQAALARSVLGLHVPVYDGQMHYQQMCDSRAGVRTPPDGR